MAKSIKSVLDWAEENGEVKVVDRILVKVMMDLIKHKVVITAASNFDELEIPDELYQRIKNVAAEIVGKECPF
jgi:hypothetical protein